MKMRKLLTSVTALTLVGGVILGTPARTRAAAGEYWISTAAVGGGTSCAAPTHEYDEEDGGKHFNDLLGAILDDVDTNNYTSVTIAICDADDSASQRYALDADTDPTNDVSGAEITIVGVQWDATSVSDVADMEDVVIDGDTDWSPFEFNDADVNIQYLTIENAWDDDTGAAIHFEQDDEDNLYVLELEHVAINNSEIEAGYGAGVYAEGSVTIVNGYFNANVVDNDIGGELYGGAIYVDGDLSVEQSEFDSNFADYGGAIFLTNGSLTVSNDSWFHDNEARDGDGGAIFASVGSPDTVTVTDSLFGDPDDGDEGNWAQYAGGDVYVEGNLSDGHVAELNVSNSRFHDGYVNDGSGGSIAAVCAEANLNRVTISDAYASGDGGGLWLSDVNGCESAYAVHITSSNFVSNTAEFQGGAISNDQAAAESLSDVVVKGSYFFQNGAEFGAAINLDETDLTVSKSTFKENETNEEEGEGGAMELFNNDNITISSSQFEGNMSDYGGAIKVNGGLGTMRLVGNSFLENKAIDGGAVGVDGFNGSSVLIATSNRFLGNRAEDDGGAFTVYLNSSAKDSSLLRNFKRNTFRGNRADSNSDGDGKGNILLISYDNFRARSTLRRLESMFRSGNVLQGARIGLIVQLQD